MTMSVIIITFAATANCVCVWVCVFCFLGDFRRRSRLYAPATTKWGWVCVPARAICPKRHYSSRRLRNLKDSHPMIIRNLFNTTTGIRMLQKSSWHMCHRRWRWIYIGGSVIAVNLLHNILYIIDTWLS